MIDGLRLLPVNEVKDTVLATWVPGRRTGMQSMSGSSVG
jgi:hypothetical protein